MKKHLIYDHTKNTSLQYQNEKIEQQKSFPFFLGENISLVQFSSIHVTVATTMLS